MQSKQTPEHRSDDCVKASGLADRGKTLESIVKFFVFPSFGLGFLSYPLSALASPGSESTCLELCERGTKDPFVDCVVDFSPAPETAYYSEEYQTTDPATGQTVTKLREYFGWNHDKMPGVVLGPPKGVFDTVSLGCGGSLTVGFVDPPLIDGPGPDLIVFENPFSETFPEPVRVEVSDDGCSWAQFPCNPVTLEGCGGVKVVKALPGTGIDPTDPTVSGGDSFDLAEIGVSRARFVRVVSVSREYWLAKEQTEKWCDPGPLTTGKGGSDIDAFALVHTPEPAPAPAVPLPWLVVLGSMIVVLPAGVRSDP